MRIDGTKVMFGFGDDGQLTDFDEPRLLAYTWGEDHLRWEIRPTAQGCVLLLTHTFDDRYGAASFASGWHTCIAALGAHLGGDPAPEQDTTALHEDYVHRFGLHLGQAHEVEGGWRVRLERQLTTPVEQTWAALHGERARVGAPPPAPFTTAAIEAGPVREVEPYKLLVYGSRGGVVRWELAEGTGHGPRLILTHTGAGDDALQAWQAHVEELAGLPNQRDR